jgi:hypothetical protein
MARCRLACLVLVSNWEGQNPLERQHCMSLRVTYWSAPLPATRCCPALVENSFPGDWNRWYLWCLSVVLTWRAGERRVFLRFPDSSPYLLVTASLLLLTFVTLACQFDSDLSAPYFVTLSHALRERPRRVTRSPRAVPPGPAWAPGAGGRVPVCWPSLPDPARETAAPTCRQSAG